MVEDERRAAGWQSWTTVRALAATQSGLIVNVMKAYVPYALFWKLDKRISKNSHEQQSVNYLGLFANRPPSIDINVLTWLRGLQTSIFGGAFFVSKSLLEIKRPKNYHFDLKASEPCWNIDISNLAQCAWSALGAKSQLQLVHRAGNLNSRRKSKSGLFPSRTHAVLSVLLAWRLDWVRI